MNLGKIIYFHDIFNFFYFYQKYFFYVILHNYHYYNALYKHFFRYHSLCNIYIHIVSIALESSEHSSMNYNLLF